MANAGAASLPIWLVVVIPASQTPPSVENRRKIVKRGRRRPKSRRDARAVDAWHILPFGLLFLSTLDSVTLASEMVSTSVCVVSLADTRSRARARTSWRAIHFPFASRSTSTHAVHAVSMRASLQRDVRAGESDAREGWGPYAAHFASGGRRGKRRRRRRRAPRGSPPLKIALDGGLRVVQAVTAPPRAAARAPPRTTGSVAGTSPSAPAAAAGASASRGFAEDITRVGPPAPGTDRAAAVLTVLRHPRRVGGFGLELERLLREDAALRFAAHALRVQARALSAVGLSEFVRAAALRALPPFPRERRTDALL